MRQLLSLFALFLVLITSCKKDPINNSIPQTLQSNVYTNTALYNIHDDKLWGHRANNINLANELLEEFNGIELDIIFDAETQTLCVKHEYEDTTSLTLDHYFQNIHKINSAYFWLDFKNLDSLNEASSLNHLISLCDKYSIKNRIIIESSSFNQLAEFSRNQIATSYWVPHFTYYENPPDTAEMIRIIEKGINTSKCNAISASYELYPFLSKYFPNCNTHLWVSGFTEQSGIDIVTRLHTEKNIKVILVDFTYNFIRLNR